MIINQKEKTKLKTNKKKGKAMTTNTKQEVKKENTNVAAQNPAKVIKIGLIIILIRSEIKDNKLEKPVCEVFIIPTNNKKPVQEPTRIMTPQQAAKVLGVSMLASEEEITKAYRKLCKQWHPDTNPDKEAAKRKMQQINDAYNVMLQHVKERKPIQTTPVRPVYESPVQKALNKLKDAVHKAKKAKEKLDKAAKQRDKIAEKYAKTPAKDPKKQKLFAQLQKASKFWAKCLDEKLAADAYVKKCADEYIFSFRIKTNNNIQQQHTYQRAA